MDGPNELRNTIATFHPGEKATLEIMRGTSKMTVQVTLTDRDAKKNRMAAASEPAQEENHAGGDIAEKLGMQLGCHSADQCDQLGIEPGTRGVIVLDVVAGQGLRSRGAGYPAERCLP